MADVIISAAKKPGFQLQNVPIARSHSSRRSARVDTPGIKGTIDQRKCSNCSAFSNSATGEDNGTAPNYGMATNTNVSIMRLAVFFRDSGVCHRSAAIVIRR